MEFLDLPVEVISDNIFPFLLLNDLLRIRRVCTYSKSLADDYIRVHAKSERYITVNVRKPGREINTANNKNLSEFLQLDNVAAAAATHFYIENSSEQEITMENTEIQNFIHIFGKKITHLKINLLVASCETLAFFEAIPSLTHLTINKLFDSAENGKISTKAVKFPENLLNLKSLEIGTYFVSGSTPSLVHTSVKRLWYLIDQCSSKLEIIRHPFIETTYNKADWLRTDPGVPFQSILKLIRKRENVLSGVSLKFIDLEGYEEDSSHSSSRAFYRLITTCSRNDIKILNLDATLIKGIIGNEEMDNSRERLNSTIVSTKNLTTKAFGLELPLLEKIWIHEKNDDYLEMCLDMSSFVRHEWPNLKELKLVIGNDLLVGTGCQNGIISQEAIRYFFVGIKRKKLETLNLNFSRDYLFPINRLTDMPYPKAKDVIYSCVNLKSLTLRNWPGTNKIIALMWKGLPLLEKVELSNCKHLGNVAFIGESIENPVFFQLTRLTQLTLAGIEKSPKITDQLFSVVLRHMPLKKLFLTSHQTDLYDMVDNVESQMLYPTLTMPGIRSLKGGKFATTIETFPISKQLKLKDVTEEEMVNLELEFRSAQML